MTISTHPGVRLVATSAQSTSNAVRLLDLLVCLVLVTSTLRWFTVASYGNVSVEPVHVALVLLVVYLFVSTRSFGEIPRLLSYAPIFWVLYLSYLLLSFAFLLRKGFNPAIVALLPQFLYIPAFFAVYFCLFKAVLGSG